MTTNPGIRNDLGLTDTSAGRSSCACCSPADVAPEGSPAGATPADVATDCCSGSAAADCCGGATTTECCGASAGPADAAAATAGVTTDVVVEGMTCAHCVSSVTEELSEVDGVTGVEVDLNAGGASRVRVTSAAPVDDARIRAAIEEAGYTVAGSTP